MYMTIFSQEALGYNVDRQRRIAGDVFLLRKERGNGEVNRLGKEYNQNILPLALESG